METLAERAEPLVERVGDWLRGLDRARAAGALVGAAPLALLFGNAVLGIVFLAAVVCAAPTLRDRIMRWRYRDLLLSVCGGFAALTVIWWSFSALFSLEPLSSFEVILRMTLFVGAGLLLAICLAERPDARRLGESVLLIGFPILMALAAASMYGDAGLLHLFTPFHGPDVQPPGFFKSYASVIAVALPILLWIGWRRGGGWVWLALVSAPAALFVMWGDGLQPARAGMAGLVAAGLAALLIAGARRLDRRGRAALFGALGAAGLALAVAVVAVLPGPPVTEADRADPPLPLVDFHRQAIWGFVADKALDAPLVGHGINVINKVEGAGEPVLDLNQEYVPSHPHNWVLEVAAETGLPGFLLLAISQLLLAAAFVRAAWAGRAGGYAGAAAMAAFWFSSMANFSIWSAWWQVVFIALLLLPAARTLKPVIAEPEPDDPPGVGGTRIGAALTVGLLTLALALVWTARRTEAGYVVYKRLAAENAYVYDAIRPAVLETQPAELIRPRDAATLAAIRADLTAAVWGDAGLPEAHQPDSAQPVEATGYGVEAGAPPLAAIERFTVPIEANYTAVGYVLRPEAATGRGVVYAHGYAGDVSQAARLVRGLLEEGATVALLNFPGYAENAFRRYDHPRFGPILFDHDYLLHYAERPMRFYIEPAIVAANRLRAAHGVEGVGIAGFSAGGWVAAVAAAADPRFDRAASVASFLPIYMRDWRNSNEWTPPHFYAPLIRAANYLEVPVLAGSGDGRAYLQIFNRYDACCYRNRYGALYQQPVEAAIGAIGAGGDFGVAIDETHARHQVSPWAIARLADFLTGGGVAPDERHPDSLAAARAEADLD